jgi:beta-N-acetylhexosaminidase
MRYCLAVIIVIFSLKTSAQNNMFLSQNKDAKKWADSVYNSLSEDERIAQLMVIRLSTYDFTKRTAVFFDKEAEDLVKKYDIGGICLFQGNPIQQANILNHLQSIAKTPILTCMDAEWGVGMRMFDSVESLPKQIMLGAMQDSNIIYQYGKIVGEQCKRIGVNVNYAPVVDINNNPDNPIISDRSFGEDKYKVALYGVQYMKGLQDVGVMACAKHFPGHGDVTVDSHFDLPVINKSMAQLDSLELYPFKKIFDAGIGSVMIAHLYIPAIDSTPHQPTSLSKNNVTGLMRDKLGYTGLTFTDALEMQGVKKYFSDGLASVEALIAGNDMLCLPGDVPQAIGKIKEAIANKKLSWDDIELHCKKLLVVKYQCGLAHWQSIDTTNIIADLNKDVFAIKKLVAENAITLLNKTDSIFFPFRPTKNKNLNDIAYVGIGIDSDNIFAKRMRKDYNANVFYFEYKDDPAKALSIAETIRKQYKTVVIGIHNFPQGRNNNRTTLPNFGITAAAIKLATELQQQTCSITFVFGNPYALKNWCNAKNLIACYEDDDTEQNTAVDLLQGKILFKGKLPVTVCSYKFGSGILFSSF